MTRAAWASLKVVQAHRLKFPEDEFCRLPDSLVAKLLIAEHKRVVRVVKRLQTAALETGYPVGYLAACEDILNVLQKGRT